MTSFGCHTGSNGVDAMLSPFDVATTPVANLPALSFVEDDDVGDRSAIRVATTLIVVGAALPGMFLCVFYGAKAFHNWKAVKRAAAAVWGSALYSPRRLFVPGSGGWHKYTDNFPGEL
jgi:hypothetical protein